MDSEKSIIFSEKKSLICSLLHIVQFLLVIY